MQEIDQLHAAVDLSDCSNIPGAVSVDIDACLVRVARRGADGTIAEAVMHLPAGVRIVRLR